MSRIIHEYENENGELVVILSDLDDEPRNGPRARRVEGDRRSPGRPERRRHRSEGARWERRGDRYEYRDADDRYDVRDRRDGRYDVRDRAEPTPSVRVGERHPSAPVYDPPDRLNDRTERILGLVEVATEAAAEFIPLPDKPPAPTGDARTDMQNQSEHVHALHAHRVLTSRIRASGRVLGKVFRLLLE